MNGVNPIPTAVLFHLDTFAVVLLVLGGDVVPALANLAGQDHIHPFFTGHLRSLFACVGILVAAAGLEPATPRL